eukprot:scaffold256650_cov43-Tisochrysis_lutea.AAC.1
MEEVETAHAARVLEPFEECRLVPRVTPLEKELDAVRVAADAREQQALLADVRANARDTNSNT